MCETRGRLWGKILNDEIEIHSLTRNRLEEALDVLDKAFYIHENVCKGCEINLPENSEARFELRKLCALTAEDGCSLIAIDVKKSKIVGVSFNKIQYIPENNEDPFFVKFRKEICRTPHAQALMDFMIDVDAQQDVFELYNIDCVCELMFLGTLPEYVGRGIGRTLGKYTIELTRELSQGIGINEIHPLLRNKRPRAVTAIFTSQFSQKVGDALDFKILSKCFYNQKTFRGKSFAERIQDPRHQYCVQVAKLV